MILVTGGAGFIGSNFIHGWLNTSTERIINLDSLTYAGNLCNLSAVQSDPRHLFVRGDIGDAVLVKRLLTEHSVRAVVHFAAESHVDRSIHGPEDFISTNIVGTFRLLESVLNYWTTLRPSKRFKFRFLHVSTDEVFGTLGPHDPPFHEEAPYRPNSPYAASKAASDHLVRGYHQTYGLPVLTTNCSNNYGPWQFPEKLIPLVIANAISEKPLPIYGDGKQVRDWLYVSDHCSAIREVLARGALGEVYCIGGSSELPNITIVETLCDTLDVLKPRRNGRSYRDLIQFVRDRPGHDRRYAINADKIKKQLGWMPTETFKTGIEKTVRWYLKHQNWVSDVTSGAYREWIARNYQS